MDSNIYETIKIGDVIKGESTEVTREKIRGFAEASLDYNALHLDDKFMGRSFGKTTFKGVIAHGMYNFSLITRMLTDWLWPRGGMHRRLETRWLKPIYPGDVVTPQAILFQKTKTLKSQWALFNIEVKNQKDEIVATGESMAEFPNVSK